MRRTLGLTSSVYMLKMVFACSLFSQVFSSTLPTMEFDSTPTMPFDLGTLLKHALNPNRTTPAGDWEKKFQDKLDECGSNHFLFSLAKYYHLGRGSGTQRWDEWLFFIPSEDGRRRQLGFLRRTKILNLQYCKLFFPFG